MKKLFILLFASFLGMFVVSCSDNPTSPDVQSFITGSWYFDFDNPQLSDGYDNVEYISKTVLNFGGSRFVGNWSIGETVSDTFYSGSYTEYDTSGELIKFELFLDMYSEERATGYLIISDNEGNALKINFIMTK